MKRYRSIVRIVFAVIFIGGGISHFVLGRLYPNSYATFGRTALIPGLRDLWSSWVMPNIGWLTILLGIYEVACGVGILLRRTTRWATLGMIVFLVFITILGYGFPAASPGADFLGNRLITICMVLLLIPVLVAKPQPAGSRQQKPGE